MCSKTTAKVNDEGWNENGLVSLFSQVWHDCSKHWEEKKESHKPLVEKRNDMALWQKQL